MADSSSHFKSVHSDEGWALLDDAMSRLQAAWGSNGDADLLHFVPPHDDPRYLWVLVKLILVDRECRAKYGGQPKTPDEYLDDWPELREHPQYLAKLHNIESTISYPPDSPSTNHDPAASWSPGDVILDLYEVKGLLGKGGMGLVYKIHHREWDVDLAVKCPRPKYYANPKSKELFLHECETWINLGLHPNIVTCYYVREVDDVPRIFAEYVEGGSLKDWIKTGRLYEGGVQESLERILDIAIQFAWGLHYAHESGLIHQDIKPDNVMMTSAGTPKVTDFGLAKARLIAENVPSDEEQSILVSTGGMTPAYCSPEQYRGGKLSRRTDIWSWAVSVLEMFTGKIIWRNGVAAADFREEGVSIAGGLPGIPRMPKGLAELLRNCFKRRQDERPRTMNHVAGALRRVYNHTTGKKYTRERDEAFKLLADSLNNKGVSFWDLGKPSKAERAFDEALRANPQHTEAVFNRGLLLVRDGRMSDEELVTQVNEVVHSQPNSTAAHFARGLVHAERADYEAAVKSWTEVVRLGPTHSAPREFESIRSYVPRQPHCVHAWDAGDVRQMNLSPSGRWTVTLCGDWAIRLWDTLSGRLVKELEGDFREADDLYLSAKGHRAALKCWNNTVRVADFRSHRVLELADREVGNFGRATLSKDGRWAVSANSGGILRLWNLASGRCVRSFEDRCRILHSMCLSTNGRWLITAEGNVFRLWSTFTGECIHTFKQWSSEFSRIMYLSADGHWMLLQDGVEPVTSLWQVSPGQRVRNVIGPGDVSSDAHWLLSGLCLCHLPTGQCVRTLSAAGEYGTATCLSQSGRWALVRHTYGRIQLWTLDVFADCARPLAHPLISSGGQYRQASHAASLLSQFLRSGRVAAAKGEWDRLLVTCSQVRKYPELKLHPEVRKLSSQAGQYSRRTAFVSGWCGRVLRGHSEPLATMHEPELRDQEGQFVGHSAPVTSVCLSKDGRRVLSGSWDHTIRLWEVSSGRCIRVFKGHTDHVESVCLSADGRWAMSGSIDGTFRFWRVSSGRCIRSFETKGHVYSLSFSRNGRWALVAEGSEVSMWDIAKGQRLRTFAGHTGTVFSVVFSADDKRVLSGSSDQTLCLWEISTGRCIRVFKGHIDAVMSVSISSSGRWVLSGSNDTTLRLWDTSTGRCVHSLYGHEKQVDSVCFSADERWAVSGGRDGVLRLWELSTGTEARVFEGHADSVRSVCISSDGSFALSGSFDRDLRLWELDWDYTFPGWAEWDEGARPYLRNFLISHTRHMSPLPVGSNPTEKKISMTLKRVGTATWKGQDFEELVQELQDRGYGWLRPEGVRRELEKMAKNWQGSLQDEYP